MTWPLLLRVPRWGQQLRLLQLLPTPPLGKQLGLVSPQPGGLPQPRPRVQSLGQLRRSRARA